MIIALFIVVFGIIFFNCLIGNYFFNIALNPKISKKYILRSVTQDDKEEEKKNKVEGEKWISEFAKQLNIISDDNLILNAYEVINPIIKSNIWVILVHGYMGCAYEMVQYAKEFINMGYNTLLVDLRAHGKSEGNYIGMGWKDRKDLLIWINKLCTQNKECKIILYGVSMGAATVMMTSGENIPKNVKLCIEDCGYSSVEKEFKLILKNIKPCISSFLINLSSITSKIRAGYTFKEASTINQIKKSTIPILFIHGDQDRFVPFEMLDELYNAANFPKDKLIIKNAGHVESSKVNPELYWKKICSFIENNIN